ncbi:actin interacting protein 3-domain-containing protein [Lipomyces orientalis]|uniref:Actin interacting protein 3-domain-containing protein n=1 Tax=Lipomyces orientalis TaxID=1233043 RepID=A0ACC3TGI8_9ASCO
MSAHSPSRTSSRSGGRTLNRASAVMNTGSAQRNTAYKRQISVNTIESSVTKLLVATKQLLECLTQWAEGDRSDKDVSDVYVSLGNEFNTTSRAFQNIGIDVSDLGDVPGDLRVILEETLSRERSQAGLDIYLPAIREIIVKLLQGLRDKQGTLRRMMAAKGHSSSSTTTTTVPTPVLVQQPYVPTKERSPVRRSATSVTSSSSSPSRSEVPSRSATVTATRERYQLADPYPSGQSPSPPPHSLPFEILSPQHQPVQQAGMASPQTPDRSRIQISEPGRQPHPHSLAAHSAKDPLAALQRGEALERRASRRFSAYQFAKLGAGAASAEVRTRSRGNSFNSMHEVAVGSKLRLSSPAELEEGGLDEAKDEKPGGQGGEATEPGPGPVPEPVRIDEQETTATMPIFIQLGRQVKKAVLDKSDISIAAVRLLFIERFSYSPGAENFPELYILDKDAGVRYELEESTIGDICAGSVVSLNIEPVDEGRKAIEDGVASMMAQFAEMQTALAAQADAIAKVCDMQQTSAGQVVQAITNLEKSLSSQPVTRQASPVPAAAAAAAASKPKPTVDQAQQLSELASLRKDIAALRQIHTALTKDVDASLADVREKVAGMSGSAQTSIVVAGNAQVQKYSEHLSTSTDDLLTRVDDLQDVIESLRKDVASRGVRPLPRQLDAVAKDIAAVRTELATVDAYIKKEKLVWKRILEKELDNVVEEQQFFTHLEDLVGDLSEDLEGAVETFDLVRQVVEQQLKNPRTRGGGAAAAAAAAAVVVAGLGGDTMMSGKDAVLREVRALNPNHESRVEAIERAEKLRQKVNESRVDEFERELEEFVGEGKLKKSGGIEEVERVRRQREEQVWREWSENNAAMAMRGM